MAKVPNGVETLPKISIASVGCTNVTDDRQTDGRTTTYSEREHEFTFAKNCIVWPTFLPRKVSVYLQPLFSERELVFMFAVSSSVRLSVVCLSVCL